MFRSRMPVLLAEKEQRERRRITHEEIAETTQIRRPTISAWMSHRPFSRLEASVVVALCAYFDVSIDELVEVEASEEPEPNPKMEAAVA